MVGAFVNFGADYLGPGRIFLGGRGTFRIGELDGRRSDRVDALVGDIEDAEASGNVLGYLWSKQAYGAMLFATAVSDLSIADALADRAYRPLFTELARQVLDAAPCPPEPFDGFDPADIEGSIERLVEFNRRSAKTHSGIYRDLAVRRRRTEVDAILGPVDRPLVRRTAELIHAIEDGRRVCERANLDLLAAYERLGELGAAERRHPDRRRARPRRVRAAARRPRRRQGQHRHGGAGDDQRLDRRRCRRRPSGTRPWSPPCAPPAPTCSARPTCWSTPRAASTRRTA